MLSLDDLAGLIELSEQVLRSVPVSDPAVLNGDAAFWSRVRDVDEELGETGRVLVRPSGTEPKVRVMVESLDAAAAEDACTRLVELVERAGRLYERVQHLDRRMYLEPPVDQDSHPVLSQLDRLQAAFGSNAA